MGLPARGNKEQKIAQPRSYLPRLDAVETHGHFRSRRPSRASTSSFDGACQDQDRLAGSPAPHLPLTKHWAAWMHQREEAEGPDRSPATCV